MEIGEIKLRDVQIRSLDVPPVWGVFDTPSQSIPYSPPVTINIGVPIVDIPGCVEAHEVKNGSKSLPNDDERGLLTYCDAGVPSFNPPIFEPNQSLPTPRPKVDTRFKENRNRKGEENKEKESNISEQISIPNAAPPATVKIDCPTEAQKIKEPVGTYLNGFREKVVEYKLVGTQCIQITDKVSIPEQILSGLPSAGTVVTTSSIAVVATASALMAKPLADVLLKVIKPTVKKVMKKIAKIRGKQEEILSVRDRQDLQRERTEAIRALRKVLKPKG